MSTFRLWQILVVTVSIAALGLGSLAFFDQKLDIRLLVPGLVILGLLLGRLRCPHCGWPAAFDAQRFPRPLIKPRRVCTKCGESLD
jgi:hypothetical protein